MYNNKIDESNHIITPNKYLNPKPLQRVSDNYLLNYALYYAGLGFPVLPIHSLTTVNDKIQCSCRAGAMCNRPAKHPRTRFGHTEATTNEYQIREWWTKFPTANIGIITGRETGIFVLDIDPRHGGEYSLEELEYYYRFVLENKSVFEPLSGTLTTKTGSGGRHLYFKYPQNHKIKSSSSLIGNGLDIKADDSYIIVAPSLHKCGNKYQWFGFNTPIKEAPKWLLYEIVIAEQERSNSQMLSPSSRGKTNYEERVPEGQRNKEMMRYISGLVNSFPKKEVLRLALKKNKEVYFPPLPDYSIRSTVDWAWRKFREKSKKCYKS